MTQPTPPSPPSRQASRPRVEAQSAGDDPAEKTPRPLARKGRRPKADADRRDHKITVALTGAEYDFYLKLSEALAEKAPIDPSAPKRRRRESSLSAVIRAVHQPADEDAVRVLIAIKNSLPHLIRLAQKAINANENELAYEMLTLTRLLNRQLVDSGAKR